MVFFLGAALGFTVFRTAPPLSPPSPPVPPEPPPLPSRMAPFAPALRTRLLSTGFVPSALLIHLLQVLAYGGDRLGQFFLAERLRALDLRDGLADHLLGQGVQVDLGRGPAATTQQFRQQVREPGLLVLG